MSNVHDHALQVELEKINRELKEKEKLAESEKQELIKLEKSLEQLRSSSNGEGEKEGDGFGLLNIMGIFLGGGLGGFLFLQKGQAKSTEEELGTALTKEQVRVEDLMA